MIEPHKTHMTKIPSARGFSIVEMMVAMVIGLIVSIAIYGVLATSENKKRTTTSISDIDQAGSYALYVLDKSIRSAGSGFSANSASTYGCTLNASDNGTTTLPVASFPAPFNTVMSGIGGTLRLAPVVIVPGAGINNSDAIIVMAGGGGLAEFGAKMSNNPTPPTLNMTNVAGFQAGNLLLISDSANCLISQVDNGFTPAAGASSLPLGGRFYTATGTTKNLANYQVTDPVINIGSLPTFRMMTVGANSTLYSYDFLQNGNVPVTMADSIYELHAYYGVDIDGNPSVASVTWVNPAANVQFSAGNLMSGAAATAQLQNIKAIRLALIMRTSLPEKPGTILSESTITLFSDTGSPMVRPITQRNYRYKVFEATIPLRNNLLIP